jgi:hypothetical protein
MAIYRSDQALVTFGTEAAQGGYPELAYPTAVTGGATNLSAAHPAGSRSILVDNGVSFAIGDYIAIGYATGSDANPGDSNSEIRRIISMDNNGATGGEDRLYLDAPTGFNHVDDSRVKEIDTTNTAVNDGPLAVWPAALSNRDEPYNHAMRFVPGIYDTVEVADQETAYNPTYALGSTAKRSPTFIYRGEQSFTGAISGMTLLNGWPLRYAIGKITTAPSTHTTETNGQVTYNASPAVAWNKGDQIITLTTGSGSVDPYTALVVDNGTPGNNRDLMYINHSGKEEIVQVYQKIDDSDKKVLLAHPLRFDHITTADDTLVLTVMNAEARTYTHTIKETSDLDTIALNVHLRDSGETLGNDFNRRYYGGHVGTSVIAAEEQGLVTCSWDGIQFLGMAHNQGKDSGWSGSGAQSFLPRHAFMRNITDTGAKATDIQQGWVPSDGITSEFPLGNATQPYYFSQGSITLYGVPIATIRSFSLTINNNPEPRYYIGGKSGNRFRGPYEIVNQRRDYAISMTVVEPTSRAAQVATASSGGYEQGSQSVFKQVLMEGDAGGLDSMTPEGLSFTIEFSRDDLHSTGVGVLRSTDYIKIEPDYVSGTTSPAFGLSKQGMFIQAAKYNLDGSSPIQADLDIILRNVKIEIADTTPVYP